MNINKNIFFLNIKNGIRVDFILKDTATNESEVTKLLASLAVTRFLVLTR